MEYDMPEEKPTADSGASIHERLESLLAAKDTPAQPQAEPKVEAKPEPAEPAAPESPVEPEDDASDEEPGPQVELSDLAEYLGIEAEMLDVDEDGKVAIKTKIDGKEGTAKLADFIKSYQLQGHLDNKSREVAEQQKALQERRQQEEAAIQARVNQVETLANIANQELLREFQQIDWNTLRTTDPAEYAALYTDFKNRQSRIDQMQAAAQNQRAHQYQINRQMSEQALAEERALLPKIIPEWADQKVAEKEIAEIIGYAVKRGMPEAEARSASKSYHVAILRDAMLHHKAQQSKAATEQKVKAAPKLVRPGQSVDASQRQEQSVRNLKSNIKKSGGKVGIAEYLLATGKV